MKRLIPLVSSLLIALSAMSQVPQFGSDSYVGWIYSNPSIELNVNTILNNRIVLYTNSLGFPLTLTSPQFQCYGRQTINMTVTWMTDQWQSSNFNVDKVGLTAALLDANGVAVDSVTYNLTSATVSRTNIVKFSITVPRTMANARLRFASWKGDVNSNGAVRQIVATTVLKGDVNQDGEVSVADINAIVEVIMGKTTDGTLIGNADVNGDQEIGLADINDVIDIIVGR